MIPAQQLKLWKRGLRTQLLKAHHVDRERQVRGMIQGFTGMDGYKSQMTQFSKVFRALAYDVVRRYVDGDLNKAKRVDKRLN